MTLTLTDVFNNRPFRMVELTAAINMVDVVPSLLGILGEDLFPTQRIRGRTVAVYKADGTYRLIPTSPIGAPPVELEKTPGELRPFFTRRLAKASTIYAEEMTGVLNMPMMDAVDNMQGEIASRSTKILADMETTHEHMRLGAVQGKVVDADGTTLLDDWFANWGAPPPLKFYFDFADETSNIRGICYSIRDKMWYASRGAWVEGRTRIHALCGGAFFEGLVTHPTVERLYLNYQAAQDLSDEIGDTFPFGGIVFHRYRGTPNGDFAIPDNECRMFPVGSPDVFSRVLSPAEFAPFVGQAGQDSYSLIINDQDRQAWSRVETYCYPLYTCQRPEMLMQGSADASMGGQFRGNRFSLGANGGPRFTLAEFKAMQDAGTLPDAEEIEASGGGEAPKPGVPAAANGPSGRSGGSPVRTGGGKARPKR